MYSGIPSAVRGLANFGYIYFLFCRVGHVDRVMSLSLWGILYLSSKAVDRIREIVAAQMQLEDGEDELGLRKPYGEDVGDEGEWDRDETIISQNDSGVITETISQDDSGVIIDSKITEVVTIEENTAVILSKEKTFNENCCMRCYERFYFIFNQKVQCYNCQYFVCKSCAEYDTEEKGYVCKVCIKQLELHMKTCDWFYDRIKQRFKRFGSAKVVRSLYKRKTDSDSENDSGYHPAQYSNSLPVGKKSRPNILGLFEVDPNHPDGGTILEERDREDDATTGKRLGQLYNAPYTCTVAIGREGVLEVKDTELQHFCAELGIMALGIKQMLEKQSPDNTSLSDDDQEAYERKLDNHRRNISSQLSSLTESLHIAIDNQCDPDTSPEARHQMVQEVINECLQQFVGHKVQVVEDSMPQSEDDSQSNDNESSKAHEDMFANAIVNSIEFEIKTMQGFVSREERNVRASFTHLSNQATISQLSLLMSESETDTDNILSNDTSRHDDTLSDVGTTELHELCVVTKDIGHQMPLLSTESGIYMDDGDNGGHSAAFSRSGSEATDARNSGPSDEDDSFDDIVKKNLSDEQWDAIEAKTSPLSPSITNVDLIRTTIAEKDTFDIETSAGMCASIIEEETIDTVSTTLPSISVSCDGDDDTKMADSDDGTLDGDTDDPLFLDCIKNHTVPLPSFEDVDDALSHTSHDVDDIVPSGADSSTAEEEGDAESEDGSWNLSPSSSSLFSNISAYDNFGKKKVGRDDIAPVMMLIPNSDEFIQSPRVGDRDADEMSSDLSDDGSDTDTDHQEESGELATEDQTEASTNVDDQLVIEPISTEAEEIDPKFTVRPCDASCTEGDSVTFECQVTGTEPIDVFWYRSMAEVQQLEDDEHYDITLVDGRCTLEMFGPRKSDAGQYLCIGVNELGQCSQSFQLSVKDSTVSSKAPEFLKPLHDVETFIGNSVKFRCKINGYPNPKVLWFKDGKRLKQSDAVKMDKIGNRDYILSFDYVTLDEDAEYMAIARNIAGEARSTAQLIVDLPAAEEAMLESPRNPRQRALSEVSDGRRSSQSSSIYPDTEDLLKVAQQMSDTRGRIMQSAENVLESADGLSAIHRHLDEMDERLDVMQSEGFLPHGGGDDDTNNNTSSLLRDYDDMMSSAASVRSVTSSAMGVLSSANQRLRTDNSDTKTVILTRSPSSGSDDDEVELHLSYVEFEQLFEAGIVSKLQLSRGRVKRSELARIHQFMHEEEVNPAGSPDSHHSLTTSLDVDHPRSVDCGLKQVDSKRYRRDYVINRDASKSSHAKWQVRTPSAEGMDVVRGSSSQPQESALSDAEEQIYVTASMAYTLEQRIKQLEHKVEQTDDDTAPHKMAALEDEVAQVVVETTQQQQMVSSIESNVADLHDEKEAPEGDWRRALASPSQKQFRLPRNSPWRPDVDYTLPSPRATESRPEFDEIPTKSHENREMYAKSRSISLTGETPEDSIPACRTEADDALEMPSVKRLMSRFKRGDSEPTESSVTRVYSLTGRDLPKTVREKLRRDYEYVTPISTPESSRESSRPRRRLDDVFPEDTAKSGSDIRAAAEDSTSTPSSVRKTLSSSDKTLVTSTAKWTPSTKDNTPTASSAKRTLKSPRPTVPSEEHTTPKRAKETSSGSKPGRNSAIMERAAFWDNRITEGKASDKEVSLEAFPELSKDMFKSADDVLY